MNYVDAANLQLLEQYISYLMTAPTITLPSDKENHVYMVMSTSKRDELLSYFRTKILEITCHH